MIVCAGSSALIRYTSRRLCSPVLVQKVPDLRDDLEILWDAVQVRHKAPMRHAFPHVQFGFDVGSTQCTMKKHRAGQRVGRAYQS
jgi:hypothetical protein